MDNGADVVYLGKGKFQDLLETLDKMDLAESDASKSETIENNEQEDKSFESCAQKAVVPTYVEAEIPFPEDIHVSESQPTVTEKDTSADPASTVSISSPTGPTSADTLIAQGRSFISGLMQTLQSPEATTKLIDSIVKEDETTGQTYLNIPVSNKQNVNLFVEMLGKLLGGGK